MSLITPDEKFHFVNLYVMATMDFVIETRLLSYYLEDRWKSVFSNSLRLHGVSHCVNFWLIWSSEIFFNIFCVLKKIVLSNWNPENHYKLC